MFTTAMEEEEKNEATTLVQEQEERAQLFDMLQQEQFPEPYQPVTVFYNEFIDESKREKATPFNIASILSKVGIVVDSRIKFGQTEEEEKEQKKTKRQQGDIFAPKTKIITVPVVPTKTYTGEDIEVDGVKLSVRLPKQAIPENVVEMYWLNNRKQFVNFITQYLESKYRNEMDENSNVSCDSRNDNEEFTLLTHQKVVRDYMNLFTPYRGLLLYHGLGSGKTCTSIAIAEGMKSSKQIIVMVPASLLESYKTELKKCGDKLYRIDQHWDWIDIPDSDDQLINTLSQVLSLRDEGENNFIRKHKGVFLINVNAPPNFDSLSQKQQKLLQLQIDKMIEGKYTIFGYTGLNRNNYEMYTKRLAPKGSENMFDNKVVIIDEAHNLVSRIINKLDEEEINVNGGNNVPPAIEQKKEAAKLSRDLATILKQLQQLLNQKVENEAKGLPALNALEIQISNQTSEATKFLKNSKYNLLRDIEKKSLKDSIRDNTFLTKLIERLEKDPVFSLKKLPALSLQVYEDIMKAENARVVMLSGTPILNKANEMGIMFNMLRGVIKTYKLKFDRKLSPPEVDVVMTIRKDIDYFHYDETTSELTITRNPYGFMNAVDKRNIKEYGGVTNVQKYTKGDFYYTDKEFIDEFIKKVNKSKELSGVKVKLIDAVIRKLLPDSQSIFTDLYIKNIKGKLELKDKRQLELRILGLTSFFKSAQEGLLPRYDEKVDLHIEECDMSDFQYSIYKQKNDIENKKAPAEPKNNTGSAGADSYKVFTRLICNFAVPERPFPVPSGTIKKTEGEITEEFINNLVSISTKKNDLDDAAEETGTEVDDFFAEMSSTQDPTYATRVQTKIKSMKENAADFFSLEGLNKFSPKFSKIIRNITDPSNIGLNLVYSQFKTLEGLTLFSLALQYNNFTRLDIKNGEILLNGKPLGEVKNESILRRPKYIIYEGDVKEREIIKKVYNGQWSNLPTKLISQLNILFSMNKTNKSTDEPNNNFGEIVKVLMITSSGSEGINLSNTRYVHIMEPYWNNVRIEQVIGRARRICSHKNLPPEYQTVSVYIYVSRFGDKIIEKERLPKKEQNTTDQILLKIMREKENISSILTEAMKESAFDCNLYANSTDVKCLVFSERFNNLLSMTDYAYKPNHMEVESDVVETVATEARMVKFEGKKYAGIRLENGDYQLWSYEKPHRNLNIIVKESQLE